MLWDIINFLPEPTFAIDADATVISWNRAMDKILGVKAEEMIGKSAHEYSLTLYGKRRPMLIDMVLNPDPKCRPHYSCFKQEDNSLHAEHSFQLRGETRRLWCKASLTYDHNNQVIGAIEAMQDITDLRTTVEELKNKSLHLEEANTALKVLQQHRKNDRKEIGEDIANNVNTFISPYLTKLKATNLEEMHRVFVDILGSHLTEIVSPFLTHMRCCHANLIPRETQIAELVKQGKSAKEISQILNIALHTANNYRKSLRKIFSLQNKDKNLRTHLLSFT